jgi:predicted Zn-dependent peptidase
MITSLLLTAALAGPAVDIPYEAFALDNGLKVILAPDHRVPLVTVNITYDVGSADERAGRTGFAHLFEHLMFMGTQRAPKGMFDAWMEAEGASNNAWTAEDRTDYYDVGPSHTLPLLLWLEADRLQMLGKEIDQQKLDLQREVVRNERRQTSENEPYGITELKLPEILFPADHPYHHPVIGSHEDLQAASVADVQAFFAQWYVPNNASLVIAGDFDPAEAKALVQRDFSIIPRAKDPRPAPVAAIPPGPLGATAPQTVTDRVDQPRVIFAWQSPSQFAAGDAELDVLANILSDGKASKLYQRLVYEKQVAQDVYAAQWSGRRGSEFVVWATAREGTDVDALQKALDDELAAAVKGLDADEVQRARAKAEKSFVERLESVQERASLLNTYQSLLGDPGYVARDLARYTGMTLERVRDTATATLRTDRRAVLRIVPEASK